MNPSRDIDMYSTALLMGYPVLPVSLLVDDVAQVGDAAVLDHLGVGEAHRAAGADQPRDPVAEDHRHQADLDHVQQAGVQASAGDRGAGDAHVLVRSEEHTSEL